MANIFVDGVLRETGGKGVDILLNSLAGELLHASWKCVAPFSKMIELGKRDLAGAAKLDMSPFLGNRTYSCIDMAQVVKERPDIVNLLLTKLVPHFEQAIFKPLDPRRVFEPLQMHRALLHFAEGRHVGKTLVKLDPDQMVQFEAARVYRPLGFRGKHEDACYLLVGGVGGLGRSIATWLVERGATSLTFLSRSAGMSDESALVRKELEFMGCVVTMIPGRVDRVEDVRKAIKKFKGTIKGVFQLAMILKDAPIADISWSEWTGVIKPKVQGTYNLHTELLHHKLDFFWLASSLVTVIGQIGQGNYSAPNTFLEAFTSYRHSKGLPASVLNISPIDGVGYVAENAHTRQSITFQGMGFTSERAFLEALELSLLQSLPPCSMERNTAKEKLTANPPQPWTNPSQIVIGLRSEADLKDASARTNWRLN